MKILLKNLSKSLWIICVFCSLNAFLVFGQSNCGVIFLNNATDCDVCGPGGGSQLSVVSVASEELIVKANPGSSKYEQLKQSLGVTVKKRFTNTGLELWKLPPTMKVKQGSKSTYISNYKSKVEYINAQAEIKYAEPNYKYGVSSINDTFFNDQWALANTSGNINVQKAWNLPGGSDCGLIGLVDSGVDWQHEDLVNNIYQNLGEDIDNDGSVLEWNGTEWIFDPGDENGIDDDGNGYADDFIGWDFVHNDNDPRPEVPHMDVHGTHIAGIIAAEGNNTIGITGVCHTAQVMPLKCFDIKGVGTIMDIIEALEYCAANNVKLINNSWGGNECSFSLYESLLNIFEEDVLFVCAAGNNSANLSTYDYFPASYNLSNIVSVIAVDESGQVNTGSNYGKTAHIAAPGDCIISTFPTGVQSMSVHMPVYGGRNCSSPTLSGYGYLRGTSMAAAYVTGALGVLFNRQPTINAETAKDRLICRAKPVNGLDSKCKAGGVLDVFNMVIGESDLTVVEQKNSSETCFFVKPDLTNVQYQWNFDKNPQCDTDKAAFISDKAEPCFENHNAWDYCLTIFDECGNGILKKYGTTGNKKEVDVNQDFNDDLCSVYPNPVKDVLNIQYYLQEDGAVNINIHNIAGQQVMHLSDRAIQYKGMHQKQYPVAELQSGIYFLEIETAKGKINRKVYKE